MQGFRGFRVHMFNEVGDSAKCQARLSKVFLTDKYLQTSQARASAGADGNVSGHAQIHFLGFPLGRNCSRA